jgi:hypothetical protein
MSYLAINALAGRLSFGEKNDNGSQYRL